MTAPSHNEINLEKYENAFKEGIKSIVEKIYKIFKKHQEKEDYQKIINEIRENTESIAQYLKENHIIELEYHDFREIQLLINETLKHDNNEEYEIILDVLREFIKITEFKFNFLTENLELQTPEYIQKEFREEYSKFNKYLFQSRVKFYSLSEEIVENDMKEFFEIIEDEYIN